MTSTMRFDKWQNSLGQPYGALLQVENIMKTSIFTTTSTSFVDVTDLSATITPRFSSSKILINVSVSTAHSGPDTNYVAARLMRNGIPIAINANGWFIRNNSAQVRDDVMPFSFEFFDSPATTSLLNYSIQFRVSAGTGYLNRPQNFSSESGVSSITIMEIAQ
jgi:hypothetical protein